MIENIGLTPKKIAIVPNIITAPEIVTARLNKRHITKVRKFTIPPFSFTFAQSL